MCSGIHKKVYLVFRFPDAPPLLHITLSMPFSSLYARGSQCCRHQTVTRSAEAKGQAEPLVNEQ